MASYKDIQGFNIQNLTADPDNASSIGQIYYNSTTGSFKAIGAGVGTWSSGGSLNTLRNSQAGFGTPTAAVSAGGDTAPGARITATEEYNGTSWTSVNPLGTARQAGDATGTQTAGIMAGGRSAPTTPPASAFLNNVETYDGTNWTEVAEINTARYINATFGIQTSAITAAGNIPGANTAVVEEWNGTSWTEIADVNSPRSKLAGGGTVSSGIVAGGDNGTVYVGDSETYNGSSWTTITSMNTGRANLMGSGSSSTAQVVYGGDTPPYVGNTEIWNGSSWTETTDMSTARGLGGSTKGNSPSALAIGGSNAGGRTLATEEYVLSDFTINTLTTS